MEFEKKENEVFPIDGEAHDLLGKYIVKIRSVLGCSISVYDRSFSLRFRDERTTILAINMLKEFHSTDDISFLLNTLGEWIADDTGKKR